MKSLEDKKKKIAGKIKSAMGYMGDCEKCKAGVKHSQHSMSK